MQRTFVWLTLTAFVLCGCGTSNEKESTEPAREEVSSQQVVQKTTSSQSSPKTADSDPSQKTAPAADQQVLVTEQKATTKNTLDLSYISNDFVAALFVNLARILNSDFVNSLLDIDPKVSGEFEKRMQSGKSLIGIDPRKIEQVVLLFDKKLVQGNFGSLESATKMKELSTFDKMPFDSPETLPTLIVRFTEPIDEKILLQKVPVPPEEKIYNGKKFYVVNKLAAHFPDNKTVLISQEDLLKKMLNEEESKSPLITHLTHIEADNNLILVMDVLSVRNVFSLGEEDGEEPEQNSQETGQNESQLVPMDGIFEAFSKLKYYSLIAGGTGDSLLKSDMQFDDAEAAKQFFDVLKASAEFGKVMFLGMMQGARNDPTKQSPEKEALITMGEDVITNMVIELHNDVVIFEYKIPKDFEKLPELLKPLIQSGGDL